jgi:alkylation response protein AidB-like acyl-CoA dehydrogenase
MSQMTESIEERAETAAMIRESAAGLMSAGGGLTRVRSLRAQANGFDRNVWQEMCAMGWPALRLGEESGGAGLGMLEFCALAEELGAGLAPEPLIPCDMSASLLSGPPLAALLSGEKIVIPAWQERANSLAPAVDASFSRGLVNGRKVFLPLARGADAFLVTTQSGTAWVDRDADGVSLEVAPTVDGGHFGTLTLVDAPGELVARPSGEDFRIGIDGAALATGAYLLGVMEGSFKMTLEYLGARKQFGRAIGSNQVLQHRAVDLNIQIALTRASIESAARTFDSDAPAAAKQAATSRAKARAAEAAMLVTRQAIQLHGAIGYTDDCDVGLYLRKAMTLASLYGSADVHRARFAAVAGGLEEG